MAASCFLVYMLTVVSSVVPSPAMKTAMISGRKCLFVIKDNSFPKVQALLNILLRKSQSSFPMLLLQLLLYSRNSVMDAIFVEPSS